MYNFARKILPIAAMLFVFAAAMPSTAQTDDAARAVELFQKGQDAQEKGDLAAAIDLYSKALELLPEFPEAELQRGNAYLSLAMNKEAEASFRKALKLREGWSLASASLGSVLVAAKKFEEASPLLKDSIESDPMNPLALSAMTELLIETKASEPLLREHLLLLNSFAGKARPAASALTAKAVIEQNLGERVLAKESATRALQIAPRSRSAISILADIAIAENDLEKAEGHLRNLEIASPGSTDAAVLKARILNARGKRPEAVALLESLPNPPDQVKDLLAKLKDVAPVDVAGLEAKILRTPDDADALAQLCVALRVPNPTRALEYCRRASTLEPNEMSHAVNFGAALVQANRYDEAVALFRKLLTLQPEHATARANLATALFQLKRYPEAKTEFRWLTEKQPDNAVSYYFLGIIHDQLEEYLDAMANYRQFLKLADPEASKLDLEKVNLRLPSLQKQIKDGKGKKTR